MGALIVVLDREGRIVRFNRACERVTGYSFEEAGGKCIWELFLGPEEAGEFRNLFLRIRDNVSRTEYESCWVTRDGNQRTIASMLPSSGGPRQSSAG